MDARRPVAAGPGRRASGYTLVELALALAILGILAAVAVSGFLRFQDRARAAQVIVDLRSLSTEIDGFEVHAGRLPTTLGEIGPSLAAMRDVWGNAYQYTPVATTSIGQLRKDKFLVPINSDYDLFSRGPDGKTQPPLASAHGRDDIVRASNGSYYGVAQHY